MTGQAALAAGAWDEARRALAADVEARETPEALEGLGLAGWWLDEADLVFDSRERAYKLYVERGDRRPYTVRLKFPAHYAIPAHSHLTDENVVVSRALTFGMGEKLTKGATNKTLAAGGYALMPADMNHFAYTTTTESTVVLYGVGPVEFKYVNPSDDPRNSKATR